jgi:hypothetical protein
MTCMDKSSVNWSTAVQYAQIVKSPGTGFSGLVTN